MRGPSGISMDYKKVFSWLLISCCSTGYYWWRINNDSRLRDRFERLREKALRILGKKDHGYLEDAYGKYYELNRGGTLAIEGVDKSGISGWCSDKANESDHRFETWCLQRKNLRDSGWMKRGFSGWEYEYLRKRLSRNDDLDFERRLLESIDGSSARERAHKWCSYMSLFYREKGANSPVFPMIYDACTVDGENSIRSRISEKMFGRV